MGSDCLAQQQSLEDALCADFGRERMSHIARFIFEARESTFGSVFTTVTSGMGGESFLGESGRERGINNLSILCSRDCVIIPEKIKWRLTVVLLVNLDKRMGHDKRTFLGLCPVPKLASHGLSDFHD